MNNFLRFLNPSILSKMTGAMLILLLHLLVLQKSNSWNNLLVLVYVVLPKLLPTCPYLRFVIMLKRKTVSYGLVHTLLHRYIIYIPNNCVLYVPILIAFMIARQKLFWSGHEIFDVMRKYCNVLHTGFMI